MSRLQAAATATLQGIFGLWMHLEHAIESKGINPEVPSSLWEHLVNSWEATCIILMINPVANIIGVPEISIQFV